MKWEVFEDKREPGQWRVEASDFESEGECYVVIFCGWKSKELAEEYHSWKSHQGKD